MICVGVLPSTGFLTDSGIELSSRGHVVVDKVRYETMLYETVNTIQFYSMCWLTKLFHCPEIKPGNTRFTVIYWGGGKLIRMNTESRYAACLVSNRWLFIIIQLLK